MRTPIPTSDTIDTAGGAGGGLALEAALAADLPGRIGGRLKLIYADGGRIETLDDADRVNGRLAISALAAALPCFTGTAAIATATGPRLADELRPGDRIATRDHGFCEIAWIGRHDYDWRMLGLNPFLRPVMIRAGALGQGLPMRDLLVSPNHRMLVARHREAPADDAEALVPACDLIGRPGIERSDRPAVAYLQILLARHEVILAEGAWSESYQPAPASLAALSPAERRALERAVPAIAGAVSPGFAPVRPTISADKVAALAC